VSTQSERRSREIRFARTRRRPPSLAVTGLALAVVFALVWAFFVRAERPASTPTITSMQGAYTWRSEVDGTGETGSFSAGAGGNAAGEAEPAAESAIDGRGALRSAYDATARIESTLKGGEGSATWSRTVGSWPPIWRVATRSPLDYQGLAAVVRAAVEDRDEAVGIKPLRDGERTVWRAAMTLDGGDVQLVVDQATGIVTWYSDGRSTFTADVVWASPPPPAGSYAVDAAGLPMKTRTDDTFTYEETPSAAGRAAGYEPLVSDLSPDGYVLDAVALREDGRQVSLRWLGGTPEIAPGRGPKEPVIALLYSRGLSWFTMEQAGPKTVSFLEDGLTSRLDAVAGEKLSYRETTLLYGAFRGATAATWYQRSGPSLFVAGRRRAVFVTGALTRQELISFAEGLKLAPVAQ
jgi:hypothetical protein